MRWGGPGILGASARHAALALFLALGGVHAANAQAQDIGTIQSEILTLDPDRLFAETEVGQRLTEQYQSERDALIANNRELEAELRAEEQALTDARKTMSAPEFRAEADAFDAKVRSIRAENDQKVRDLERGRELAPLSLMRMAEPILVQVMRDTGGKIILDNRQVLLRADVIDITDLAIARVDAEIGDGSGLESEDVNDTGSGLEPDAADE
ncbi:OmpH family outer membrane protein [Roseovarius sp. Pro17]|uniref:OmpH family outer membrane protein n=1 Tax=Roseovarius sp. Pro17 TaxID=3108175 RepID=UPI002D76CCD8|nr:OmpH family outer membrane protein [Roseovarius sp. Pro17]